MNFAFLKERSSGGKQGEDWMREEQSEGRMKGTGCVQNAACQHVCLPESCV